MTKSANDWRETLAYEVWMFRETAKLIAEITDHMRLEF